MQQHTVFGYELLKDSKSAYLVKGAEIALTHHEKWDGSGYPKGLVGNGSTALRPNRRRRRRVRCSDLGATLQGGVDPRGGPRSHRVRAGAPL